MKFQNIASILTAIIFFAFSATSYTNAQGTFGGRLFTVNDNGDTTDINLGDGICLDLNGKCTLRAAIQEANAATSADVINFTLPSPSIIDLTIGELKIISPVNIIGPGARRLTVQRSFSSGTLYFGIFNLERIQFHYSVLIRGLTIKNGYGAQGGIYVDYDVSANLKELVLSSNSGAIGGGIGNAGTVNLQRSLISSNFSTHQGGGFINLGYSSNATITNSTITNNTSASGGGIYNNGWMLLINNTISHNNANSQGSGIVNALDPGATVSVFNTIIGSNNISTASALSGPFNSLGSNIITDARNSTGFINGSNNDQVSDNNVIDPLLGNLSDNGGQTNTRALQAGSPAVNTGNNCIYTASCASQVLQGFRLTIDQRPKYSRLAEGTIDVGAVESNSLPIIGGVSFGTLTNRNRLAGSLIILTNVETGEKRFRIANPTGNFSFSDLTLDVYILEIKSKRSGLSSVAIFEFDSFPYTFSKDNNVLTENFNFILNK